MNQSQNLIVHQMWYRVPKLQQKIFERWMYFHEHKNRIQISTQPLSWQMHQTISSYPMRFSWLELLQRDHQWSPSSTLLAKQQSDSPRSVPRSPNNTQQRVRTQPCNTQMRQSFPQLWSRCWLALVLMTPTRQTMALSQSMCIALFLWILFCKPIAKSKNKNKNIPHMSSEIIIFVLIVIITAPFFWYEVDTGTVWSPWKFFKIGVNTESLKAFNSDEENPV